MISSTFLLFNLINNLGIFILMIAGYGVLYTRISRLSSAYKQLSLGAYFSLFVIGVMLNRVILENGLLLDQRTSLILLSGFFGGPITVLLSGTTAALFRCSFGGSGLLNGCAGIGVAILSGFIIHQLKPKVNSFPKAVLTAAVFSLLPLPGFLLINPSAGFSVAIPFSLSVFLITLMGGLLMFNEERRVAIKNQLSQSEKKYRELFTSLVDVTYRADAGGICEIISPSVEKICGFTPASLYGKPIASLFNDTVSYQNFIDHLKCHRFIKNFETVLLKSDNTVFWASLNAQAIYNSANEFIGEEGIIRDISGIKKQEEEAQQQELIIRQNQKMESIGTLAGGIAHDFNNILAAIVGYAEMAQQRTTADDPIYQDISGIIRSASRAKDLVRHILIFSRQTSYDTGPVEMYLMIKEVIQMIQATFPDHIVLEQHIKCRNGVVLADPTEIHQMILSILTNAVEAIGSNRGLITVTLDRKKLTRVDLACEPDIQPGSFINFSITDTGAGIPDSIINRVFDPFFTTKEIGQGSGLGLSLVHGISKRLKGFCTLKSSEGCGTTVSVFLPEVTSPALHNSGLDNALPTGNERILFVDDEPVVVEVTARNLEHLGYHVTTQTSSKEAIALFNKHPEAFDLVITDQIMPNITGEELSKELLKIRPDIPIIMFTGYSADMNSEKAKCIGIEEYLLKPVEKKRLAAIVRKVLDNHLVHA